jgi:hypothetical protein
MEIANSVEPVQDGRIHIELINWPFLTEHKGSPAEYGAGLQLAIERVAVAPRERHLCEVHTGRLRTVRMTMRSRLSTAFYVVVIAEVDAQ